MEDKQLAPSLRKFLEDHPHLFQRCDSNGQENPQGEFWNVREDVSELKATGRIPAMTFDKRGIVKG